MSRSPRHDSPLTRRVWLRATGVGLGLAAGCVEARPRPALVTCWPLHSLAALPKLENISIRHTAQTPFDPRAWTGMHAVLGGWADSGPTEHAVSHFTAAAGVSAAPGTSESSLPRTWGDLADPRWEGRLVIGEPASDNGLLATLNLALGDDWNERLGIVLRVFANAQPSFPGGCGLSDPWVFNPSSIRVECRAGWQPAQEHESHFRPFADLPSWRESAIVFASRITRSDRAWLDAVSENRAEFAAASPGQAPARLESLDLIADWLQAACVTARPELRRALAAIRRAERVAPGAARRATYWLLQPPPWPPASLTALRASRDGDQLLEQLFQHLLSDPNARRWLKESSQQPAIPLDRDQVHGLARAADGRLVGESRFRDWLRAEWTAWARQRYRRAARLASGARLS